MSNQHPLRLISIIELVSIIFLFITPYLAFTQSNQFYSDSTSLDLTYFEKQIESNLDVQTIADFPHLLQPEIHYTLPPYYLATGTAIFLIPNVNFLEKENVEVRQVLQDWLLRKGIAVFYMKYHESKWMSVRSNMDSSEVPSPFDDPDFKAMWQLNSVAGALNFIRKSAEKYDLKSDQIGILTFSGPAQPRTVSNNELKVSNLPDFIITLNQTNDLYFPSLRNLNSIPLFMVINSECYPECLRKMLSYPLSPVFENPHLSLHVNVISGLNSNLIEDIKDHKNWVQALYDWLENQGYLSKLYPNKYEKLYGQKAVSQAKKNKLIQMQNDYAQLERYREENKILQVKSAGMNRVVFLGNSITEGWVKEDPDFFADNNFIGRGISGQTSVQLLLRFRQDVVSLNPEIVVIHIGTNDIAENTGPYDREYTLQNISSMLDIAEQNGIKVILAAVLPATKFEWNRALGDRSKMIVELNTALKKMAEAREIPFVDYHQRLKNNADGLDPRYAADGVHPTQQGYQVMKSMLYPIINSLLQSKGQ